jgi:hypothetical protein
VRVHGRVAPSLAGELQTVSRSWLRVARRRRSASSDAAVADQTEPSNGSDGTHGDDDMRRSDA